VVGKVLLVVVVVPPMLNYAGLQRERAFLRSHSLEPPGLMVDIGWGQELYLRCEGEGLPTVVLEAPLGEASASMRALQAELAPLTRVCAYDRAGLGLSTPPPRFNASHPGEAAVLATLGPEHSVARMVADLHRLLTVSAPQPRPLLLLGAGLGGLVARTYALVHPQEVGHLVLVEPLPETLLQPSHNLHDSEEGREENPWPVYWAHHLLATYRLLQVAAMTGLSRLALLLGLMRTGAGAGPGTGEASLVDISHKHFLCDPWAWQAVLGEALALDTSLAQVAEVAGAAPGPSPPSTMVTGSLASPELSQPLARLWSRAQQQLITRLGSSHHVITGADRQTLLKQPLLKETLAPIRKIIKHWRQTNSISPPS